MMRNTRRAPCTLADIERIRAFESLWRTIKFDAYDSQTARRSQQQSKSEAQRHCVLSAKYICGDDDEDNYCGYGFHCDL